LLPYNAISNEATARLELFHGSFSAGAKDAIIGDGKPRSGERLLQQSDIWPRGKGMSKP
jgi:hypothetical protein